MKRILSLLILAAVMLSLCACNADTDELAEKAKDIIDESSEALDEEALEEEILDKEKTGKEKIAKYDYKHDYENTKEHAILYALDKNGKTVWKYATGKYEATEYDRVVNIGENGDHYYLIDDGTVVCLDKYTGKTVWKQGSVGAANTFCFGKNADLYVTGILGPEATKIDKNGKIVWTVKHYEGYQWPYGIKLIDDNTLEIKMTSDSGDSEVPVRVDAKTGKLLSGGSAETSSNTFFTRVAGNYSFASGAGAWSTDIVLKSDGTFTGDYHDSEFADENESYSGLCYTSKFHGKFSNVKKINDYCYTAELVSLTYDTKKGKEEIVNDVKYCYVDAYGFEKCKTVTFYLKGANMKDLPKDFITWGYGTVGLKSSEQKLPTNGFYNATDNAGFFDTKNAFLF